MASAAVMGCCDICQGDFPRIFTLAGGRFIGIGYRALWACTAFLLLTTKYACWLCDPPVSSLLALAKLFLSGSQGTLRLLSVESVSGILLVPFQLPPTANQSAVVWSCPFPNSCWNLLMSQYRGGTLR